MTVRSYAVLEADDPDNPCLVTLWETDLLCIAALERWVHRSA